MNTLKISKKDFNEILAEIIIEEGHYADPIPKRQQKVYKVYIAHNYYTGKYHDYGVLPFYVLAEDVEDAIQIVKSNKDAIEQILRTKKYNSKRKFIAKNDHYKFKDNDVKMAKELETPYSILAFDDKTKSLVRVNSNELHENKKKSLKEADDLQMQAITKEKATNPENAPITDRETLSLKAKSIKEGIELWFRQFRVKEDTIQLQHGNKAIISDGSGNSFYILFRVNSWNPPAVEIKEMKLIDITDYASEVPEDL